MELKQNIGKRRGNKEDPPPRKKSYSMEEGSMGDEGRRSPMDPPLSPEEVGRAVKKRAMADSGPPNKPIVATPHHNQGAFPLPKILVSKGGKVPVHKGLFFEQIPPGGGGVCVPMGECLYRYESEGRKRVY